MTGIKRYDVDGRFEESSEGDFVRFEDIIIYLSEQDYQYNKQTNELIARHAEQLEVAAEFCRQYQIEIARLKVDLYSEKEKNRVQFENSKLNMENIKNLLNEAYEDNSAKQRVIEELKYEIDGMTDENQTQKVLNNHLQFLLDSVMLEFCPDEMTEEQMENWKKHQKKSNLEIEL